MPFGSGERRGHRCGVPGRVRFPSLVREWRCNRLDMRTLRADHGEDINADCDDEYKEGDASGPQRRLFHPIAFRWIRPSRAAWHPNMTASVIINDRRLSASGTMETTEASGRIKSSSTSHVSERCPCRRLGGLYPPSERPQSQARGVYFRESSPPCRRPQG